jgi:hypothetical protein
LFFDLPPIYFIVALNYEHLKEQERLLKSRFDMVETWRGTEASNAAVQAVLLDSYIRQTVNELTDSTAIFENMSLVSTS